MNIDHWTLVVRSAPGVTRTPGQRFRKPLLYPPELQGRFRGPRGAGGRKQRNVRELGVVQQGLDAPPLQPLTALQEIELDEKAEPRYGRPRTADELGSSVRRAAGGEDVVHAGPPTAGLVGVMRHLERVGAATERVEYALRRGRQLA